MLFLGFGALAAAAVKKLLTPPEPAWQSTPTSGRDYSSAPAGTTSRPAADKPAGAATPAAQPDATTDTSPSNGKTDDVDAKTTDGTEDTEAKPDEANASSNGTAKKAAGGQRRSTPSKPTDS
jgi:hypothetical protein